MSYYISTVIVYLAIDVLSAWSLNLQYGYAGILNFCWIIYQAAGAYFAAVVTLGPDTSSSNSFQTFILGAHLPWPLPLLVATAAGALLSLFVGLFALRSLRRDYQAAVMLTISLIATQVISAVPAVFNGANGVSDVPRPLYSFLHLSLSNWQWAFAAFSCALCIPGYLFVEWLAQSAWGRSLRASRDHEAAAATMGLNVPVLRIQVYVVGGAIAGLTGGLLVEFIGAWSPGAWGYAETLVLFAALMIGGVSNNRGALIGTFIIPVLLLQVTQFLPSFGFPGLIDGLEWVVIGSVWMLGMFFRPRGIVPEARYVAEPGGVPARVRRAFRRPAGPPQVGIEPGAVSNVA